LTHRNQKERRQTHRAWVSANAVVRDEHGRTFAYAVDNVSLGGAFLSSGPSLPVGSTVTLTLTVDDTPPVRIVAKVLRCGAHGTEPSMLAVVFLSMSASARRLIGDAVADPTRRVRKAANGD
jgi:PilZ domain